MISRASRMTDEGVNLPSPDDEATPFLVDLERIRFSPFYSRLSAVTQVIGAATPTMTSPMHIVVGAPKNSAIAGMTAPVRIQIVMNSSARSATPAT